MIYDNKKNMCQYKGISKNLDCAIAFLQNTDFTDMSAGKYPVQGEDVFALVQTPNTRKRADALWETHKQYLDIQFLLSGAEKIGFQNINLLSISQAYDAQKDIAFYEDNGLGFFVDLVPNTFVVCFPEDAHMPLVCAKQPQPIKKVVMKVKIEKQA